MGRIVIVGSGIAGLVAALEASHDHEVILVTKTEIAESNTRYAQGGIAAVLFPDDSIEAHVRDTMVAGAGLSDERAVRILCTEGPDRVRDLIALGVAFDREGGSLARGMEAAHSHARVLHAGGDATGAAIEAALVAAVRTSATEVVEHAFLTELIVEAGRVSGIEVLVDGALRTIAADTVILASGGAGQLYPHTTNPTVTTGDGVAAAWRAGAEITDAEFYQFHPTALATGDSYLISEAVRGEGAVLRNNRGERFMVAIHPDAELAPRDVVARGIAVEMAAQNGEPIVLDATALGAEFLRTRFPGLTEATLERGLDWTTTPVPVTPAAHYWMGGIRTDLWGRTTLPGLSAIGEAAWTGVHGANRLASNSLLESIVFAHRSVRAVRPDHHLHTHHLDNGFADSMTGLRIPGASANPSFTVGGDGDGRHVPSRSEVQQLMWRAAGLSRNGATLHEAATTLSEWSSATKADAGVHERETANLVDLARIVVAAARAREESRGAHYRTDFPATETDFRHHLSTWVADDAMEKAS